MIRKQTVASLFARFAKEEEHISKRAEEIRAELEQLEDRLAEVQVIRKALQAQSGGAPAPKAAAKKPGRKPGVKAAAAAAPEAAAAPAAKAPRAKQAAAKKPGRKPGRKPAAAKAVKAAKAPKAKAPKAAAKAPKAKAPKAAAAKAPKAAKAPSDGRKGRRKAAGKGIQALGIVDAAFELARQKGVREANAGDVIAWFEEAGYKTRDGVPNRNSVYVSLNRESTEGPAKGRNKITRPEKGKFQFHWDAAAQG